MGFGDILRKVKKWINSQYRLVSYDKLGELLIHLAKGGFIKEGFELVKAMLKIKVNRNERKIEPLNMPAEPSTVLEVHDYERIVKEYIPEFAKITGISP